MVAEPGGVPALDFTESKAFHVCSRGANMHEVNAQTVQGPIDLYTYAKISRRIPRTGPLQEHTLCQLQACGEQ